MDAVKFLEEEKRMIEFYKNADGSEYHENWLAVYLNDYTPEDRIKIVEKWYKEHPRETYKSHYLTAIPQARTNTKGIPYACRQNVYGGSCPYDYSKISCKDCWNELYKENKK